MRSLLNFLERYHRAILFIFLEIIALYLLAKGNSYHNSKLMNGLRGLTYAIEGRLNYTHNYLRLLEINRDLAAQNSALRERLDRLVSGGTQAFMTSSDTLFRQEYKYLNGSVVDNSVNTQKNFFTINKGMKHGVAPDMAVISGQGVAGVIIGCSENFSVALSVLNVDFKVSARLRSSGYFGSVSWDGHNPEYAILSEIPQHVAISEGDTIETTGFSSIFPEGIMVGTVSEFEKSGGDFYNIKIKLATEFRRLNFVDIIGDLRKTEKLELLNDLK
ncbi:MAG: rod shape-determining protein MreC [Bacteroidales bacterium]|nr:rod shape-determining protein MreC [Bacteroidales bacterium]